MAEKTYIAPMLIQKKSNNFFSAGTERSFFEPVIQPKLTLNAPNDIYEKEADRAADAVMRMPDPQVQMQPMEEEEEEKLQMMPESSPIQRMCPRCRARSKQGKPLNCPECEKEPQMKPAIQLKRERAFYSGSQSKTLFSKQRTVSFIQTKLAGGQPGDKMAPNNSSKKNLIVEYTGADKLQRKLTIEPDYSPYLVSRINRTLGGGANRDPASRLAPAQRIAHVGGILQDICPLFQTDASSGEVSPVRATQTTSRLAGGSKPVGCCCQHILTRPGSSDWRILVSDVVGPHTSPDSQVVVVPGPDAPISYGNWTAAPAERREVISNRALLGHELCGHAALLEMNAHQPTRGESRLTTNVHDPTVNIQNLIATEQGVPASDLRGLAGSGTHRGESFARIVISGYPINRISPFSIPDRSEQQQLFLAADLIQANAFFVNIVGHTDPSGPSAINDRVSKQRANAVKGFLAGRVSPRINLDRKDPTSPRVNRFRSTIGLGESQPPPAAVQGNPANWRRVEIFMAAFPASTVNAPSITPTAVDQLLPPVEAILLGIFGDECEKELIEGAYPVIPAILSSRSTPLISPALQTGIQPKCARCEEETLQMKSHVQLSTNEKNYAGHAITNQLQSSNGNGSPLPPQTQSELGNKMNADFSGVNIHTDSKAIQMNRQLGARAFTHGSDIYFNRGEFNPSFSSGKHLLAHELTHVMQQKGINQAIQKQNECGTGLHRGWGGFTIDGDCRYVIAVRNDLNTLNQTSQGSGILSWASSQAEGIFGYSPLTIEDGSAIAYLPLGRERIEYHRSYEIRDSCSRNTIWRTVPSYVYLFHEIVHYWLDEFKGYGSHVEKECMATGLGNYFASMNYNENKLRCELGLPIRPCYGIECQDFRAPECEQFGSGGSQDETIREKSLEQNMHASLQPRLISEISSAETFAGTLIQREPITQHIDTPIGTLIFQTARMPEVETDLVFRSEVVPSDETAEGFVGFTSRMEALALALRQQTLCAVVEDQDGYFHVINSGYPLMDASTTSRIFALERANQLFTNIWWINRTGEEGLGAVANGTGIGWRSRLSRAQSLLFEWERFEISEEARDLGIESLDQLRSFLEAEYVRMLYEATGLGGDWVHISRGRGDRVAGVINFDITFDVAGRGGIPRLPEHREQDSPQPTITIGPDAFKIESRLHTLGTLIHESEHFSHHSRAVELREQWRTSDSQIDFIHWLRRQLRSGRIIQLEYTLAAEISFGRYRNSEVISRIEAFMQVYHYLPISQSITRFSEIDSIPLYLSGVTDQVLDQILARLSAYYDSLNQAYKDDFIHHVRERQRNVTGHFYVTFWNRIADILAE